MRVLATLIALLLALPALAGVNINTADAEELDALPGIGASKAEAIVEFRDAHGAFDTVQDLARVPGIGHSTLANLDELIHVGDGTVAEPVNPPGPATGQVDINTADEELLVTLPGIGATKATAIIADRDRNGAFEDCTSLARVPGIGPATVKSIGDRCTVEAPPPAEVAPEEPGAE